MLKCKNWILLVIVVLGIALRLYSIDYGLPFIVGPDEKRQVLDALSMGARHSLIPLEYTYPSFHKYVLLVSFVFYFFIGHIRSLFADISSFVFNFLINPGCVFLISRWVSVILGILLAIPVYFLGKNFSKNIGVVACFLSMFMAQLITHSQWATADIMLAFLSTCAFYYISKCVSSIRAKDFIFSGIFIGASISVKYQGAYLMVPFLLTLIINFKAIVSEKRRIHAVLISFFMIAFFAILGNLSFIFRFEESIQRFSELKNETMGISSMPPFKNNLCSVILWFIKELLRQELVLGAALVLGIVYAFYKRLKIDVIFLGYLFTCLYSLVNFGFRSLHILVYSFPVMCVFGARGIDELIQVATKNKYKFFYGLVLASIIVMPSAGRAVQADLKRINPDTRILSKKWIEKNVPPGESIAQDWYDFSAPLYSRYPIMFRDDKVKGQYDSSISEEIKRRYADYINCEKVYKLTQIRYETGSPNWPKNMPREVIDKAERIPLVVRLYRWFNFRSIDELLDSGVSYIVISSYAYNHFLFDDDPRKKTGLFDPFIFEDTLSSNKQAKEYIKNNKHGLLFYLAQRARDFYLPLLDLKEPRVKLIKEIIPGKKNLGPVIKIYKINKEISNNG